MQKGKHTAMNGRLHKRKTSTRAGDQAILWVSKAANLRKIPMFFALVQGF